MLRHRPPPTTTPAAGWPETADGFIHWARQACLIFGRDRRDPRETRPVLRVTCRDRDWVVLPGTTKPSANSVCFFWVQRGFMKELRKGKHKLCDSWYYRNYECVESGCCDSEPFARLKPEWREALMNWLRQAWGVREAGS